MAPPTTAAGSWSAISTSIGGCRRVDRAQSVTARLVASHRLSDAARRDGGPIGLDVDVAPRFEVLAELALNGLEHRDIPLGGLVEHRPDLLGDVVTVRSEVTDKPQEDVRCGGALRGKPVNAQHLLRPAALGIDRVALDMQRR